MRPRVSAIISFFLMMACAPQASNASSMPPESSPPAVNPALLLRRVVFSPSAEDIPNPEQGFSRAVELDETDLSWYPAETDNRLLYLLARLDDYRNSDLPPEHLTALSRFFSLVRQAGLKVIIRFSYNDGETYPNPAPDASLEQALQYIEQLPPVLETNKDLSAWFEAGFIGAWGERRSSANGLDRPEHKAIIRDALHHYFPRDRFTLLQSRGDFTHWYPQPLTEAQAFDGSGQARTEHHNERFLVSDNGKGAYVDYNGSLKTGKWKMYIARMTRLALMSGETCHPNLPRSDCPTALAGLERLHWTALNEAYHPDVIRSWREQGCYTEIRQRLGDRLSLLEASFPAKSHPGGNLPLRVRLHNSGFASPLLPRPVDPVPVARDPILRLPLDANPRHWELGEHTLTADLPPGEYTRALWLPDPAPGLQHDPRDAIRLANDGIWDAEHGRNVLGTASMTEGNADSLIYLPLVMQGLAPGQLPTPTPTSTDMPTSTPTPINTPTPTPTDTPTPTNTPTPTPTSTPPTATYALRFYGTGSGDIDRVKIPMSNTLGISLPVNIGATDFTIEFWLRFTSGENNSGPCVEGEDTWIYGNILFDRDIFDTPDYGDFGISLYGGRIAFGVHNGSSGYTICGNTTLTPDQWHHIAVTRRTNGEMRIFVGGVLDREYNGPAGDISYRVGRNVAWPNEPYLVIGAEKHDYDPNTYPSFSGWLDEVRISNIVRYTTNFTPPDAPFTPDASTVGLYRFDEGSGTTVLDSSGAPDGPSHGERRVGGPNNGPTYDGVIKRF
ncbi:DUF4832 domain-containing protein [Thermoflexus sp.]|uniref:DUF4832 domain-containing protein n=1 Tax=Thermoflexus sp. TaxID=1969742 RepID=UPI0035E46324